MANVAITSLPVAGSVSKTDQLILQGESGTQRATLAKLLSDLTVLNPDTDQDTMLRLIVPDGAAAHNAVYRGKYLGNHVTAEQFSEITSGRFRNLYIGDYWVNGGVNWRIADFNYCLHCGDTEFGRNHVFIVPDTSLYTHNMNATNTTDGGYVGSLMRLEGLAKAKEMAVAAFGAEHVLTHRVLLTNAVTNGKPSGGAWCDSDVELMNEIMVYGCRIFAPGCDGSTVPYNYMTEKSQLALFRLAPWLIANRQWFWLRDVVSPAYFAHVSSNGNASYAVAPYETGVRPAFPIG